MDDVKPPAPGPATPAIRALPPETEPIFMPLRLVLQPGGLAVELTRPDMLVGRHSEADVRLQLPDVSRRHCRFVFAQGRWQVFDLNSLNGIFVNGAKLKQATLRHRDQLQIGSCTFAVDLPLAAAEQPRGSEQILGSIAGALPAPAEDMPVRRLAS